jgi:sugar lactone lactonase YvrE
MKKMLPLSLMGLFLSAAATSAAGDPPPPGPVEVVATFDPSALETPESIAIDTSGDIFLSLGLTGEIRKIDAAGVQSTVAFLPLGAPPLTPCGSFIGIMGALALDPQDNLYVSLASCNDEDRGIWKVSPDGEAHLLAGLPPFALPNGVVHHAGKVYVADSELGLIWRAPDDGSGPAEVWLDDPLLKPSVGHVFPGPNGLQLFHDEIYVANSDQFTILAAKIRDDGSAGPVRVHAAGIGCDDFAFDVLGNLYATTDPFNTMVRVAPDGSMQVLLTAADGLDGPSSAAFGRTAGDHTTLYVNNAAFPFFSTTHSPKLLRLDIGIPGQPR